MATTIPLGKVVGSAGPTGSQGPTGLTGPANELTIGTVLNGSTAAASITGAAPHQTLNLTLPRGEKGETGEPGPSGDALYRHRITGNVNGPYATATFTIDIINRNSQSMDLYSLYDYLVSIGATTPDTALQVNASGPWSMSIMFVTGIYAANSVVYSRGAEFGDMGGWMVIGWTDRGLSFYSSQVFEI